MEKCLKVFGTNNCPQCKICKKLFDNKGINYEYVDLNTLPEDEYTDLIETATSQGFHGLPLVYDYLSDNFVDWHEVIKQC